MKYIESETLELKSEFTLEIKKEVIAFANSKGGTIYIGINDMGQIIGVSNTEKVCEQLSSMIHDSIRPDITRLTSINIISLEDKKVIQIDVMRGTNRPYYLRDKGLKPSGVYIRLGNTSIPATELGIRKMIIETDGTSYEEIRSLEQELTFEFSKEQFKLQGLDFEIEQQKTLGIINQDGLYTNLGLLLSDQCQHSIKVAVFKGADKTVFKDRQEFTGSVLKQLSETFQYIQLNNSTNSIYDGLIRIDKSDYSPLVIREALLNAIIHRDYSFSGSILVSLYTDRLEITSIGGLIPGLSLEDILLGISQSRNEKVANIFYRLKLVEAYGTGIKKIQSDYQDTKLIPKFNTTTGGFQLILPNRNTAKKDIVDNIKTEDEMLIENAIKIIKEKGKVTRATLQKELNLRQTKCGMLIRDMEEKGLVERIGAGRNTRYKLKKD